MFLLLRVRGFTCVLLMFEAYEILKGRHVLSLEYNDSMCWTEIGTLKLSSMGSSISYWNTKYNTSLILSSFLLLQSHYIFIDSPKKKHIKSPKKIKEFRFIYSCLLFFCATIRIFNIFIQYPGLIFLWKRNAK